MYALTGEEWAAAARRSRRKSSLGMEAGILAGWLEWGFGLAAGGEGLGWGVRSFSGKG